METSIYPIDIPDIKIASSLDFLLLELPQRYMPFMPNGLGYVNNLLKMEEIHFQTIDVNIIWYHKYHSNRILNGFNEIVTPSGYIMKSDPWSNVNTSEWAKEEVVEYFADDIRELARLIIEARPKIIGFSLNETNRLISQKVLNRVREFYSEVIVIVGGYDCYNHAASPNLFFGFDYMIIREAELSLRPLIRNLLSDEKPKNLLGVISRFDSPDRIWQDAPLLENLDSLDFPRYEWVDIRIYQDYKGYNLTPITASRGCHWSKCTFCAECFLYRRREPRKVVDEIEWLNKQSCTIFQFNESDMNGDPDALIEICRGIIRKKLKVVLTGQLRIDKRNTKDFFRLLKKAGCVALRFGVDAWSKNTLRLQKKGYTMKMVEENLMNCKAAGIQVAVNIVIGVPGETAEDVDETIDNITRMKNYIDIVEGINTLILAVGSDYYNNPDKYKIHFRQEKNSLYKNNLTVIPVNQWYSTEPYIDHETRLHRLHKIFLTSYENGVVFGSFAEERIKTMEKELGGSNDSKDSDTNSTAVFTKIRHAYNKLKDSQSDIQRMPILIGEYKEFNIVYFLDKLYILHQNIGSIDLSLEENRVSSNLVIVDDLKSVFNYIDKFFALQDGTGDKANKIEMSM